VSVRSLRARLLAGATAALVVFLALAAVALDRAFVDSAREGVAGELRSHVYGVLAAAEPAAGSGLRMPAQLPEERLGRPASGLYAWIVDARGATAWQSDSLLGAPPTAAPLSPGRSEFGEAKVAGTPALLYRYGFAFETEGNAGQSFTAAVALDRTGFDARVRAFRSTLAAWLGGAVLVLVVVLVAGLHWSLRPLRAVADEIRQIEEGRRARLEGDYPRELRAMTDNLNALIAQQARQHARFRDSLGDLAHSLKTPLAVMRAALEGAPSPNPAMAEQLDRMHEIVEHQLRRAGAAGQPVFAAAVPVAATVERVAGALRKLYASRGIVFETAIDEDCLFRGDPGDLTEIVGNLLDNAGKWATRRVDVAVESLPGGGARHPGMRITVSDDGPGFAPDVNDATIARGVRADGRVPGQGIGLAVVRDIMALYRGQLQVANRPGGGACVSVEFPPS